MPRTTRVAVHIDRAELSRQFLPIAKRTVNEVARDIRDEAQRLASVRTGRLRASIRAGRAQVTGPFSVKADVTAHAPYARFVHEGTRPHLIVARRARALHFYWEKMGKWVFFHHVNHPGHPKPNPFLAIAARRTAARHR